LKIVYLVESKFCQRDYDRFGLDVIFRRGYKDIEVWDFSCCFRYDYFKSFTPVDMLSGENYISISDKNFAMQLLQAQSSNTVFICLIGISAKCSYIFNYLNKKQHLYGFLSFGLIPVQSNNSKSFDNIKKALVNPVNTLRKLIELGMVKISTFGLPINPDFVILGGAVATHKYINGRTNLLKAHALDYDLFLASKNFPELKQNQKYAVFLDHYLPYHPDTIGNEVINPEHYYKTLNNFFEYVELKLGLEVVIAPHPRADYTRIGNPFNNRLIANYPTHNIVKNSELVITHYSTSVAFAVLYNKPLLFLNDDLYRLNIQNFINNMADFFHKSPINLSKSNFIIRIEDIVVDNHIYNSYKELYIKENNTPEKKYWDIFADYLDKITV
jgi:hypothetical protein